MSENPSTGLEWRNDFVAGPISVNTRYDGKHYTASQPVIPGSGGVDVFVYNIADAVDNKGLIAMSLLKWEDGRGYIEKTVSFKFKITR